MVIVTQKKTNNFQSFLLSLIIIYFLAFKKMQCPSCILRFNITTRSPFILTCGHSLCLNCSTSFKLCPKCSQKITANLKPNYALLQVLKQDSKQIDKFIKVCFVGSSAVGKTSLIRQFMGYKFSEEVSTTIGYDFTFKDRNIGGYSVRFQLWDSAGQQRYRAISPIHYKNAHLIIIVYNVCSTAQDNRVSQWISQAEKYAPIDSLKVIVGNKLDLIQGKVFKPLDEDAWRIITEKKVPFFETSCKSGTGIDVFQKFFDKYFQDRKNYENIFQEKNLSSQKNMQQSNLQTSQKRLEQQKDQLKQKTQVRRKLQQKKPINVVEDKKSCC